MGLGDDFSGFGRLAGEDVAGLVLAEEGFMVHGVQLGPKSGGEGHFDDCGDQAAVGNVMYSSDLAMIDEVSHEVAMELLLGQIDGRGSAFFAAQDLPEIDGLAEMGAVAAQQQDGFVSGLECQRGHLAEVGEQADAADGGGGQYRLAVGFVVERDVS